MRKVAKNSLFLAAGHGVSKAALALLFLVTANVLGPAGVGELVVGFTIGNFLRNFLDFGLAKIATRSVARSPGTAGAFLADAMGAKRPLWGWGLAGYGAAGACFAWISSNPFEISLFLLFMGAAQVLEVVVATRGYLFNGLERMDLDMVSTASRQGIGLVLGTTFLLAGGGLAGVGLGFLAGPVVSLFLTGRMLARLGIRPGPGAGREEEARIRRESMPVAASVLCGILYTYGNAFLLRAMLGAGSTGLYSAAHRLVVECQILPSVLTAAVFPLFARLAVPDDLTGLLARVRRMGVFLVGSGFVLAAAMSLLAEPILRILYFRQPEFWEVRDLLAVLAWMVPLFCLNMLAGDLLLALNRERLALRIALAACGLGLAANLLFIPRWGLWGACWTNVGIEIAIVAMNAVTVAWALRARRRGGNI